MNRSQLETEISRALNDTGNTRWPLATIDSRLELAQQDIQIVCDAIKTTELLTPTANVAAVTINANVLDILSATLVDAQGNVYPLKGKTKEELYTTRPYWLNESAGQPDSYWADFTAGTINLVPAPSASFTGSQTLTVVEVQTPNVMASGTDIPLNANTLFIPYHKALKYWVVAECLMDNNDSDSLQKAAYYRTGDLDHPGQYEKVIAEILSRFDKPTDAPARILWAPQGGRLGGWPTSKSTPLG